MARITVEDCLKQIPNRFELALAATYRARQLAQGHTPKIESRTTERGFSRLCDHSDTREILAFAG